MLPQSDADYKKMFTELIRRQMLVLGSEITLSKVKNVKGIIVDGNGEVTQIDGDPQQLMQELINQFVELSGLIVKKTMESIMTTYPGMIAMTASSTITTSPVSSESQVSQQGDVSVSQSVPTESKAEGPAPIPNDMMADLNKALDQLAVTPLSTEKSQINTQPAQP